MIVAPLLPTCICGSTRSSQKQEPFSQRRLVERIRALLRRRELTQGTGAEASAHYTRGYRFEFRETCLTQISGRAFRLSPHHASRERTRQALVQLRAWGSLEACAVRPAAHH